MTYTFNNTHIQITVENVNNEKLIINGNILEPGRFKSMELLAANPIVKQMRYATSALPFANPTIAFDQTINSYKIDASGVINNVTFIYPNSYYTVGGSNKISSSIFVVLYNNDGSQPLHIRLELPDLLPLHTLTNRPNHTKGPMYYSVKEELVEMQTAEKTARSYAEAKLKYDIA